MSPSTTLRFYSTGNPTGLKFEIEHGGERVLFDFGLEHAPGRAPFSMGLRPRPGRELADLLAVGAAPRLEGVYDGTVWDGRTAVFISHMHLDHTSLVRFLHAEVPLFYPAAMEPLRAAADACGYLPWRRPPGAPLTDRETVRWGPFAVTPIAVDHDVPGATGYLVEAPGLSLAYSGDHRWHGFHPELTAAFAEAVRGVDVLVQEAVAAGLEPSPLEPPPVTERDVVDQVAQALRSAEGAAVINLYGMNRERVVAVGEVARAAGRRLVLEPQAAALAGWPDLLDPEALRERPRELLVQLSFDGLPQMIDLPRGGLYVHSNGVPLGEYDPAYPVMTAWTEAVGFQLRRIGTSGHAHPADIPRLAAQVRPGVLLPVHSRAPEAVVVPGVRRLLPVPLRAYTPERLRAEAD